MYKVEEKYFTDNYKIESIYTLIKNMLEAELKVKFIFIFTFLLKINF